MESIVYFMDFRASHKENLLEKLNRLALTAGLLDVVRKKDLVAIKLHFGERGNTAFILPIYVRKIVEAVKKEGGIPFLTDANTLYAGTRSDAPTHLATGIENGFAYSVVNAPIIIADGLRGKTEAAVNVNLKRFKTAFIATEIVQADSLISMAHFKGHELSGFGGTIKNIGMGCASRKGKMAQHSTLTPKIKKKNCIGCGDCVSHCSQQAILLVDEKAVISESVCIGCGECILICPNSAIEVQWNQSIPIFLENMVEYTAAVLKNKAGKSLFVNFLNNISPACDCYPMNDAPVVRNIGILASRDPVAIDQASVDLVNREEGLPGSCLSPTPGPGEDKFKRIYPKVDWEIQLDYAQQLGLGSRTYHLSQI
ncbi:MAG: DUF362 domain-containing protein [Thermodesulfobacteriota bacterium]